MDFTVLTSHPAAQAIARTLPKHAQVFAVGGAVRDVLMHRPIGDLDLVVRHVPMPALVEWLQRLGPVDTSGKAWGVLRVQVGDEPVDVALPRTDAQRKGTGRTTDTQAVPNPELDIADDLRRRDVTMNAMAVDLQSGQLTDPFHGQTDCSQRVLRTVGNPTARFEEDHSRILRCLRLATQLHCTFEPLTWGALKAVVRDHAPLNIPARLWQQEQEKAAQDLLTYHEWLRKAGIETHHADT